jgi:hypothetical protein
LTLVLALSPRCSIVAGPRALLPVTIAGTARYTAVAGSSSPLPVDDTWFSVG